MPSKVTIMKRIMHSPPRDEKMSQIARSRHYDDQAEWLQGLVWFSEAQLLSGERQVSWRRTRAVTGRETDLPAQSYLGQ